MFVKALMKALNLIIQTNVTVAVAVNHLEFNMYNPKFNYHTLTREQVDGKRLYATPDGSRVPSVTTILDKTKPADKVAAL